MNSIRRNLTRLKLASLMLITCCVAATHLQANEYRRDTTNRLRVSSPGDQAFTEPIETIQIASGELGIIGKVHVKRGDIVAPGDLLLELDMTVLEASHQLAKAKANTQARLNAAKVELESKTKRYENRLELLRENASSPEEVARAKTELEVARQSVEALIEESELNRLETKRIESQMERLRVRAPIQGVVTDVRKKIGEYVSNSEPHVATVVQLNTLRVVFYLPTDRAIKIQRGDTAELLLVESKQRTDATVEYVAPITNADSGRVRVEVLIDNQFGEFRSGVRCQILQTLSRQSMINGPTQNR